MAPVPLVHPKSFLPNKFFAYRGRSYECAVNLENLLLTMDEISRILVLAIVGYSERLYFSTSIAFISAVAKLSKGSDDFGMSCI